MTSLPDSDPGSPERRYAQPHSHGQLDDPRFGMIDLVAPNHVELEISADGKTAYVHVNGVTAFHAGHINKLVVTDHRDHELIERQRIDQIQLDHIKQTKRTTDA